MRSWAVMEAARILDFTFFGEQDSLLVCFISDAMNITRTMCNATSYLNCEGG